MTSVPERARAAFAAWRERVAHDPLDQDPHFANLVRRAGHASELPALRAFGLRCATSLDPLARETNVDANLPRLARFDGQGNRTEQVVFHPGYHELGRAVYATGLMGRYATPGRELATLGFMYQLSQLGEAGHACPLACTAGLIKILQRAPHSPAAWLERLYDPDYDTHFHGSQFLTEVQGGSDVGANAVVATDDGDGWCDASAW